MITASEEQFKISAYEMKSKTIKNWLIAKAFQSKEGRRFSFAISFFLPEIFKFLPTCKLGTDDITRCVSESQNTKSSISLGRMKQ